MFRESAEPVSKLERWLIRHEEGDTIGRNRGPAAGIVSLPLGRAYLLPKLGGMKPIRHTPCPSTGITLGSAL
jgi:hypothetical protein